MTDSVQPVNITAAALIAQFSLVVIMSVAAIVMWRAEGFVPFHRYDPTSSSLAVVILVFALVTIGALVFSDEFSTVWAPLFGATTFPTLSWSTAILLVFTVDILCVAFVVIASGGAQGSPFTPIFFIMPALAIFLREPLWRVLWYLVTVSLGFTLALLAGRRFSWANPSERWLRFALWFVSIACFILATLVGWVTRPR